ncbi:MAG: hypothetical protein M1837_002010 [Sclerophora amabilis]|nr:MAG: hypothetical protein M1837_002010 [Sclerophora amabilis]
MSDAPDPKQYWGYLFRPDKTPSELLEDLLIGLATYINEKVGPDDVHCLVPSKLSAFYHAVGGDYDSFFLDTVHPSLSFIYQSLGCVHTLQPTSDDFAPPTIPALEPRGFARWQCIQLLLGPEEHVPYLQEAVRKYDIVNSSTKKVFPKVLPREAFPDKPDEDMTKWHDDVFDRLKSEAQDEQGGSQRSESGFQDYPSSVPQHDIYGDRSGAREAPGDYFSSGHENSRKFAPRGRNPPQAPHPNHPDWMRGRDIRGGFRNVQKPRKQSFPDQHYMQDPRFADVRVPPRREDVSPGSRPRSPTNVSSASSITSSSTDRNAGDDDDDDFDDRSSSLPRSDNSSSPAANRYYPLVDPPTPLHHRHQGQSHLNVPSSSPSAYPHHRRRHSDVSISPSTAPSSSPASHYAYDLSGPPSFSRPTTAQSFIQPEPFSPHRSPHTLSPSRSPYVSGPSRGNSRGLNKDGILRLLGGDRGGRLKEIASVTVTMIVTKIENETEAETTETEAEVTTEIEAEIGIGTETETTIVTGNRDTQLQPRHRQRQRRREPYRRSEDP